MFVVPILIRKPKLITAFGTDEKFPQRLLCCFRKIRLNSSSSVTQHVLLMFFGIFIQADKLLSPEFQPVLEQLVDHCARKRQICLFSATFPVTVKDFKDKHISNPYEINLMDELTLKARIFFFLCRQ